MIELELSVMLGSADELKELQGLLDKFTASRHIPVRLTLLEWTAAWGEIVQAAIHNSGPDISEIGVSWLADLVGMNALLPLPGPMVSQLGTSSQYLKGSWNACTLQNDPNMWAVPWFAGTRVLYYRRDWLEKAGLDPKSAFSSAAALDTSLQKLQDSGVERPWVVNTQRSTSTVHHITCWVWGAGGSFLSADGKAVMFAEKEALDGMEAFFRLGRLMGSNPAVIDDRLANHLFWSGQAGATLDGQWQYATQMRTIDPTLAQNIAVAMVPGVPFVGGSNLVVWKHTRRPEAAWDLLNFLTGENATSMYSKNTNLLPTRWDLLNNSEVGQDPAYQLFAQAVDVGRCWPALPFSALIENRLRDTLALVWQEVLAAPEVNVREILVQHLVPLQRRLQMSIA